MSGRPTHGKYPDIVRWNVHPHIMRPNTASSRRASRAADAGVRCWLAFVGWLDVLEKSGYNATMTTISIDEIQRNLMGYLEQVKTGETLLILENGEPIAEIKPFIHSGAALRPYALCAGEFRVPDKTVGSSPTLLKVTVKGEGHFEPPAPASPLARDWGSIFPGHAPGTSDVTVRR